MASRTRKPRTVIEFPSHGATYTHQRYGVYTYDRYPRHSVLAGQTRRTFEDDFDTLADAQAAFPAATVAVGSGYAPPSLAHLSDGPDW